MPRDVVVQLRWRPMVFVAWPPEAVVEEKVIQSGMKIAAKVIAVAVVRLEGVLGRCIRN